MKRLLIKIIRLIKRLWLIGTCDHHNMCREFELIDTIYANCMDNSSEFQITVCKKCGTIIKFNIFENSIEKNRYTSISNIR